jgi:hypothetical protein
MRSHRGLLQLAASDGSPSAASNAASPGRYYTLRSPPFARAILLSTTNQLADPQASSPSHHVRAILTGLIVTDRASWSRVCSVGVPPGFLRDLRTRVEKLVEHRSDPTSGTDCLEVREIERGLGRLAGGRGVVESLRDVATSLQNGCGWVVNPGSTAWPRFFPIPAWFKRSPFQVTVRTLPGPGRTDRVATRRRL